jgi:hypothetical protein
LHVGWATALIKDRKTGGIFLAHQIVRQFCGGDVLFCLGLGSEVKYGRRKYLVLDENLVEKMMGVCEAGSGCRKQSDRDKQLTADREEFCLHLMELI